jgi:MSHA biogenesis protein MshJ
MIRNSAAFQLQFAQVQRLWRKWRRIHSARAPGERRILIVGAIAVTWFICDSLLLTPALNRFQSSNARYKKSSAELSAKQEQQRRYSSDMVAITTQLKGDVERLRADVATQKKDIDAFQDGLVPARDMRQLLQAVLTGRSDLHLVSMKTLTPDEVRKLSPDIKDMPGLYRHGLELRLQGRFHGLLDWLTSMENWPRKVLWSGLRLDLDDRQQLFLTVTLFTLSPDADPLEIASP